MSILDLFFSLAVPFVVVGVVIAKFGIGFDKARGIYRGADGAARRDAINEKFRTNRGAIVIACSFVVFWGMTVAALVEEWGAIFFTFVVGALLIIPFATVCAVAILIYVYAVHGYAKVKGP